MLFERLEFSKTACYTRVERDTPQKCRFIEAWVQALSRLHFVLIDMGVGNVDIIDRLPTAKLTVRNLLSATWTRIDR